jgi:hypothetical protein
MSRTRLFLPLIGLLILSAFSVCYGQAGGAIQYAVPGNGSCAVVGISAEQCQAAALKQARAAAIEKAAGLHVISGSLVRDFGMVGDFIKTYARGFIVSETVVWEPLAQYQRDASAPPIPEYRVHVLADIYVPRRRSAPMGLEAKLNRAVFRDGDSMSIEVIFRRACNIAIFNLSADDRITMLFPNNYEKSSRPRDISPALFPRKEGSPVDLIARVLPGHERDVEAFLVVALDPVYPFDFSRAFTPLASMSLTGFFRKFAEIADYCEETVLTYEVTAARE